MKTLTTGLLSLACIALLASTSAAGVATADANIHRLLDSAQNIEVAPLKSDLQLAGRCYRGGGGGFYYGAPAYQSFYGGGYGGFYGRPVRPHNHYRRNFYGGRRPGRGWGGYGRSGVGLYIGF